MIKFVRLIRGYLLIVLLCLLLAVVNMAQIVSLPLALLSRRWFMRYNMEIKQLYCSTVTRFALLCGNVVACSGDPAKAENSLIFSNHQSVIDIIVVWAWALPVRTIGWIKWFAKDALKYVPGMGWGMMFVNTLFVKRDWAKDADSIQKTFAKLREGRLPTWLVIFPEGTRVKPEKILVSQNYSKRKGLPILNKVLLPRGKGIHASLQGLDGHLSAVYDLTIQYEGPVPGILEFFTKGGFRINVHAKRFDATSIPKRERELNAWLINVFAEKDLRLSGQYSNN